MELLERVKTSEPRVLSLDNAEHARAAEELLRSKRPLKVGEVAFILGVRSPATIHNWLRRGAFPATVSRTLGGHRLFDPSGVRAVYDRIRGIEAEVAAGEISYLEFGDEGPPEA